MGSERRTAYISEDVKKMTAYHEAGVTFRFHCSCGLIIMHL